MDDFPLCPVCGQHTNQQQVERRPIVPALQNTTLPTRELATTFPTGSLRMICCGHCGFVWNADFDPKLITYDGAYNNDVSTSAYYNQHVEAMAQRVINSVSQSQSFGYAEIGCGEATFLNTIVGKSAGRCSAAVGFDPSFTGDDGLAPGAMVHKTFFGADQLGLLPNPTQIVCSRHTIEHVADVQSFARSLAAAISMPDQRLFLETPDANWILRNGAFQDFFYEHCSLFTPQSITRLLRDQGLACEVTPVYDGQYMWVEARRLADQANEVAAIPNVTVALAAQYITSQAESISRWASYLQSRRMQGPVAIWGGASKGVTFSLIFSRDGRSDIECAIDLNPAKQGRFLPTSGLPVVSPETAKRLGVQTVVIMNPNYYDEILELAQQMQWNPELKVLNSWQTS